jgi:hypothetical protein
VSIIVDIAFPLPADIKTPLERRIRQIICEPPAGLLFVRVQVTTLFKRAALAEEVYGDVYRITLCGIGGAPLQTEREFLLFQTHHRSLFLLRNIARR